MLTVNLPYCTALSKNKKYLKAHTAKKRILNPEFVGAQRSAFILLSMEAIKYEWIDKEKVYISAIIYRPDFRSDPINLIEGICDMIKEAINVDDRYFALNSWDYEIDKSSPRIFLQIWQ